ncbi:MAG TPA: flagellar hook-associated protein FlgK [Solirubrobacteraceae bacterium]|jgi:flagellar hook-associated protein 1 FlgK|nr:flagellar hook-associated protein FlgK [Solirubrobacteraceae bacterium]
MSIPTLQGLQTALSGLLAGQEEIDVTGHNIANANTPGYSRQTAVLETSDPLKIAALSSITGNGAQLGTGVTVEKLTRIRDMYLDGQYREQSSALGSASTQTSELQQAQGAFAEPSPAGLSARLSAFWSAWSELASSPSSEAAKEGVVNAGTQVAGALNALSASLSEVSAQASQHYAALAGKGGVVQEDAAQLAQLNGQIRLAEQAHQTPNDLLDRRDRLIDGLSELAQVKVTLQSDGTDTVHFGDAATALVEGTTVTWPQEMTSAAGGQIGQLIGLTAPAGQFASYGNALDEVASALAKSVNALHTSTPFFKGASAATIAVAVTASQVQSSSTPAPGGNDVAQGIAALRGGAAEQGYTALVERVGGEVQGAQSSAHNAEAIVGVLGNRRQSVSGVSLDQEMTNLISFQRGYQASARTLTTMDEILDTLINHTGRTGL